MYCVCTSPMLSLPVFFVWKRFIWKLYFLLLLPFVSAYKLSFCKPENWTQSHLSCRSFMWDVRTKSFTKEASLFSYWWYLPFLLLTIFHVLVVKVNAFPLSHILLSACPFCIINIFRVWVLRHIWSGYEPTTRNTVAGGIIFHSVKDGVLWDICHYLLSLYQIRITVVPRKLVLSRW